MDLKFLKLKEKYINYHFLIKNDPILQFNFIVIKKRKNIYYIDIIDFHGNPPAPIEENIDLFRDFGRKSFSSIDELEKTLFEIHTIKKCDFYSNEFDPNIFDSNVFIKLNNIHISDNGRMTGLYKIRYEHEYIFFDNFEDIKNEFKDKSL